MTIDELRQKFTDFSSRMGTDEDIEALAGLRDEVVKDYDEYNSRIDEAISRETNDKGQKWKDLYYNQLEKYRERFFSSGTETNPDDITNKDQEKTLSDFFVKE